MIYLSTRQVADILGYKTTRQVLHLIEAGTIPCHRFRQTKRGHQIPKVSVPELVTYLERHDPVMVDEVKARWPEARIA